MAAALLSLGERTVGRAPARHARAGLLSRAPAATSSSCRPETECVLEVITGAAAKLGMVLLDAKRAAQQLIKLA